MYLGVPEHPICDDTPSVCHCPDDTQYNDTESSGGSGGGGYQDSSPESPVSLTELGRSLKPRGDQVVARLREVVEAGLEPAEIEAVKTGLAKMIANMHAHEQK